MDIPSESFSFDSQGAVEFIMKYTDNGEGIDQRGALFVYSRYKFAFECLPLLQAAKAAGEDARFVSVLSAGKGVPIEVDDLYMRKMTNIKQLVLGGATKNSLACEVSHSHLYVNQTILIVFSILRHSQQSIPI